MAITSPGQLQDIWSYQPKPAKTTTPTYDPSGPQLMTGEEYRALHPTWFPTTTYPTTSAGETLGSWSEKNAPTTPYWLPQVSPGQVAGQKMQKLPVKIPSGQLWSQFMPSWRSGLESYINYAAGTAGVIASYQDLVAQILGMQPSRSPYRAGQWSTGGVW